MSDLARMTAAPLSLEIHGKSYPFRPMDFRMIGEFEAFAMRKYLDDVERVLDHSKANDAWKEKRRQDAALLAERLRFNVTPEEDAAAHRIMDRLVSSLEGVTTLAWLAIRDDTGNPTREAIGGAMADEALKRRAIRAFNEINGNSNEKKAAPGAASP